MKDAFSLVASARLGANTDFQPQICVEVRNHKEDGTKPEQFYFQLFKGLVNGHLGSPVKISDFKLPFTLSEIGIF
jgi:hypothetical protein